jgi:hypothetical protein
MVAQLQHFTGIGSGLEINQTSCSECGKCMVQWVLQPFTLV